MVMALKQGALSIYRLWILNSRILKCFIKLIKLQKDGLLRINVFIKPHQWN